MCTELGHNPSTMGTTWSMPEVLEAYFFLRVKYLREAPGGA